jgi:hypothetical protein
MAPANLFEEVVVLTEPYLGPAAHRFVSRQIVFHLSKAPEQLESHDLTELTEWVTATLAMLTEDRVIVEEYERKMLMLARERV